MLKVQNRAVVEQAGYAAKILLLGALLGKILEVTIKTDYRSVL